MTVCSKCSIPLLLHCSGKFTRSPPLQSSRVGDFPSAFLLPRFLPSSRAGMRIRAGRKICPQRDVPHGTGRLPEVSPSIPAGQAITRHPPAYRPGMFVENGHSRWEKNDHVQVLVWKRSPCCMPRPTQSPGLTPSHRLGVTQRIWAAGTAHAEPSRTARSRKSSAGLGCSSWELFVTHSGCLESWPLLACLQKPLVLHTSGAVKSRQFS